MLRKRLYKIGAAAAVAALVIGLVPVTRTVTTSCVLGGMELKAVRARSPGFIREVRVREGDRVSAGQVLAVLENKPLRDRLWDVQMRKQSNSLLIQAALAGDEASEIGHYQAEAKQLDAIQDRVEKDVAFLELKAPFDAVVVTPDIETDRGAFLREGEAFCEVIPQRRMHIIVSLNEHDAGLVKDGEPVELKVFALPRIRFKGIVSKTFAEASDHLPHPVFSSRFGGDVPTEVDAMGRERPAAGFYQAELDIENNDGLLRPGMSGTAKIYCKRSTLGRLLLSRVRQLLRLDLQI